MSPAIHTCERVPPPPTQIRELVHLVRPEVVAVELCRDRLSLLVDPEEASNPKPRGGQVWHCRKVRPGEGGKVG